MPAARCRRISRRRVKVSHLCVEFTPPHVGSFRSVFRNRLILVRRTGREIIEHSVLCTETHTNTSLPIAPLFSVYYATTAIIRWVRDSHFAEGCPSLKSVFLPRRNAMAPSKISNYCTTQSTAVHMLNFTISSLSRILEPHSQPTRQFPWLSFSLSLSSLVAFFLLIPNIFWGHSQRTYIFTQIASAGDLIEELMSFVDGHEQSVYRTIFRVCLTD